MRDKHIITVLDEKPLARLSEGEIAAIEAHTAGCSECLLTYEAARASDSLIRARASETIDVSPFFKARVMASIRERRLSPEMPALERMWRAAGALVAMMAALVGILIAMTIFNYTAHSKIQPTEMVSSQNIYSPEYLVLEAGDNMPYDQGLDDQVLGMTDDSEDEDGN